MQFFRLGLYISVCIYIDYTDRWIPLWQEVLVIRRMALVVQNEKKKLDTIELSRIAMKNAMAYVKRNVTSLLSYSY